MGREDDVTTEIDGILMDSSACPEAQAYCYQVTYVPQALLDGSTWAGAFWQAPMNNWGEVQGLPVQPGATRIVFSAWSEAETLDVTFLAGGIGNLGTAFADTFKLEQVFTLTSEPQEIVLDMSTSTYEYVIGGFGWVIAADNLDPRVFYVENARWE